MAAGDERAEVCTYVMSFVKFARLNLFSWRHLEISSDLWLSSFPLSALMMNSFSVRQRSHRFVLGSYPRALYMMDHVMV